jgi:iron complex transport system substrate-binding protein
MNAAIKKVTDVSKTIPEGQKPTVYWMWGDIYGTAGLNSTANDLINAAGGVNVLTKWDNQTKNTEHPVLTMEAIAALNPDVIYMWYNDKLDPKDIMTGADYKAWSSLNAVKNGRVYELDDPFMYDFMTARLPVAMMKVAKDINPETFKSWDLNKEYDAYFVDMYGVHYPGFAKA